MNNTVFKPEMLRPRYWLLWLLIGLWWVAVLLPYPVIVLLGRLLGKVMYFFARRRRHIAECNIRLCFPDMPEKDKLALVKHNFECTSLALLETGMAWWWPTQRLKKICYVEGLENLNHADGKGIILLGMHFTNLDTAGACLSLQHNYSAMYRPHKNSVFDFVQLRGRLNRGSRIFPRNDLRTMIRLLRKGESVWYAPDQDYGLKHSVFVPFFGVQTATITATAKLVKAGNAVVVPLIQQRLPNGKGHKIILRKQLENFPTGDECEDARIINALIEKEIRLQPENYLWTHRRFKTRPKGEPGFYK